MGQEYFLNNQHFAVRVKKGALSSICGSGDIAKTQFVLPEALFADLHVNYTRQDGNNISGLLSECENFQEGEPVFQDRSLVYQGNGLLGDLLIEVQYVLLDQELRQTFTFRNNGDQAISVQDAAILLPCNTKFAWGEPASNKVIGHHFISGNSSHMVYTRCDGISPYLLLMPQGDTRFEYYDLGKEGVKKKGEPNVLYAYMLGYGAEKEGIAQGFAPRMPVNYVQLQPGDTKNFSFAYLWADSYSKAKDKFVKYGLVDVDVVPGMTVAKKTKVKLRLRTIHDKVFLKAAYPDQTSINQESCNKTDRIYEICFECLGENTIRVEYGDQFYMNLDFFVTEPVETLIKKRGAFIASKQFRNKELWYDGLLAEWNNETGVMLGPDCYDNIKGWRIYEVTCDDPGLSKPAFLSGKNAEYPVQEEVEALDYYIENFVWGGLQCTEEEEFPYGIYGIPDWHKNRFSEKEGIDGRLHIWRIYDYPHIALMYYNLYRTAKYYPNIQTKLSCEEYLERAYRTALAMFQIPHELDEWSAYKTGLYNEVVIEDVIKSLYSEGKKGKAERLERHWKRKIKYFVTECKDIFGSEYPFDTTGFESTHIFARTALPLAEKSVREDRFNPPMPLEDAQAFMENQTNCNIACRGFLEPAYYWYGSDYRGNNHSYTLTYMSQMGGCSLLDYALHYAEEPFSMLRLAYGSLLSSWALMNTGDEEGNYGYFFPGKEHDGAASGGFEPLPFGETWLEQKHHFGAWNYSCEIDLGFCGALRGESMILAEDPVFGKILYGGEITETINNWNLKCLDGVARRFDYVMDANQKLHIRIDRGHFDRSTSVTISKDFSEIVVMIDPCGTCVEEIQTEISGSMSKKYRISYVKDDRLTIRLEI